MGLANFMLTSGLFERAVRDWFIASLPMPRAAFPGPEDPLIISDESARTLATIVGAIANAYSHFAGIEIAHGELHLIDKHGRALLPLPIPLGKGGEEA